MFLHSIPQELKINIALHISLLHFLKYTGRDLWWLRI